MSVQKKKPKTTPKTGSQRRAESGLVTIMIEVTPEQKEQLQDIAFLRKCKTPAELLKATAMEMIAGKGAE